MSFQAAIRRALTAPCNLNLAPFLRPAIAGENKTSRPAWSRLNSILDMLMKGERFNASTLATQFGTVTKTIYRDIAYLRSRGFRIQFVSGENFFQLKTEAAR